MEQLISISNDDLPALYRSADKASLEAQKNYLRFIKSNLSLIVISVVLTSIAISSIDYRVWVSIFGAVLLLFSLILTIVLHHIKPDSIWFEARAAAESVKTISWRYMMVAEPYNISNSDADTLFRNEMQQILIQRNSISGVLGGSEASGAQISEKMRQIRAYDVNSRKDIYIRCRINDQRTWYASKARTNKTWSTIWIYIIGSTQFLAMLSAILLISYPDFQFNIAAILAATAAAFIGWLQLKQHQELANSYGLATHELGLIESLATHISTENELSEFVGDAENAISREHTMWIARRDIVTIL